jgi:hypothetical protein
MSGAASKPGLPPWGPHARFRRVQTLRGQSVGFKLRFIGREQAHRAGPPPIGGYDAVAIATLIQNNSDSPVGFAGRPVAGWACGKPTSGEEVPMLGIGRREFMALLGGAAAAWPLAARAQQREPMRRIGVLMNLAADDPEGQTRVAAFLQGLQEAGWAVGRNHTSDCAILRLTDKEFW